ncbi:hypothetical protein, partial [Microcoleus sp. MON1_C1]|uniref:hypothetical protein n=1 Tax=Microcoleus sp. MON1_C1 TaxID=2818827 RepID=UPI002FD33CD0
LWLPDPQLTSRCQSVPHVTVGVRNVGCKTGILRNGQDAHSTRKLSFVERASCPFLKMVKDVSSNQ